MYYMGFSYNEVMGLPVLYKKWFIERVVKEMNRGGDDKTPAPTKALHQNTPDVRALQGRSRLQVPSRLRRFS